MSTPKAGELVDQPSHEVDTCMTCRFHGTIVADDKTFQMVCRRRCVATHLLVPHANGMALQLFGGFPPLPPGQWCGEWEEDGKKIQRHAQRLTQ